MKRTTLIALLLTVSCGGSTRFALRAPVLDEDDDQPLARAPAPSDVPDGAHALDVVMLRPLSHAFALERTREAANVNALDEVPDSTWFTNRAVSPDALVRGACPDAGPVLPLTVSTTKAAGATPGLVVRDARNQRYMVKLDALARYGQPEISTAADAITSRLYWAFGFGVPCNDVIDVPSSEILLDARADEISNTGKHSPLTRTRLAEILRAGTKTGDGKLRVSASRFIDGRGVGTWCMEGTREDDANDVVPHEDRRELRGERFLAAWLAHWDSRDANTYDAFVPAPGGGHLVHYFLDFSDSLGGTISRTTWPEPRSGHQSVLTLSEIGTNAVGFGFVRRPWDEVRIDPHHPNLGFLDVEHFDPLRFAAQTPIVRWQRADMADLAWAARRLARIGVEHVRVAVRAGRLSRPEEEDRLVEILMGRRDRILRTSFASDSPLADWRLVDGRLCATDLARTAGVATDAATGYAATLGVGADLREAPTPRLVATRTGLCAVMPPTFAPSTARDDAPDRYAVLDVFRFERGTRTRLRAHLYDLGPRGYVLVGVERR